MSAADSNLSILAKDSKSFFHLPHIILKCPATIENMILPWRNSNQSFTFIAMLLLTTNQDNVSAFISTFSSTSLSKTTRQFKMIQYLTPIVTIESEMSQLVDTIVIHLPVDKSIIFDTHQVLTCINSIDAEAEFFADMAHIALDLAVFISPETIALRLIIFFGRVFSILSDYLPDHKMTMDELIFQTCMLIFATKMLIHSIKPLLSAPIDATSFKNRRLYQGVFSPAGLTWMQYATIASMSEWIELPADTVILEEEASLYLTYRGEVTLFSDGSKVQNFGKYNGKYTFDLIGDLQFSRKIIDKRRRNMGQQNTCSPSEGIIKKPQVTHRTLKAGPNGTLLLRIDTNYLLELMDRDELLADRIKDLVFSSMQKKLSAILEDPHENKTYFQRIY